LERPAASTLPVTGDETAGALLRREKQYARDLQDLMDRQVEDAGSVRRPRTHLLRN
jgi:hypothetical protein